MKELNSQSLSGIRDIISGQNYGFIKARLDQLLPQEAASSFAKVEIQGKEGLWYAENNLPYKVYSDASELEKEEIAIELEKLRELAYGKLSEAMPYWAKLFVVPNKDCIYWSKDAEGKISVVITQWGFDNRTIEKQADVISDIITAPRPLTQIPVMLDCKFSNGEPASDFEFYLNIFNNKKLCKTDNQGRFSIGSLFANNVFSVENLEGNQRIGFTVKDNIDYIAVFNITTGYTITVINQEDDCVPNCAIKVNGESALTDSEGRYICNEMNLTPESKLVVEYDGLIVGTYHLAKKSENNNFTVRIEQKIVKPKTITIKLRGYKGESLPDMPFKVKTDKGEIIEGITDKDGNAKIPSESLTVGKKCNLSFKVTVTYQQNRQKSKK